MDFDLEDLTTLEQTFHDKGYTDGYDHGRIHGLIEGRALGVERGYEIWEEVAFYRGFALLWQAVALAGPDGKESRTTRHAANLLDMISHYPQQNPSHLSSSTIGQATVSPLDMTKIRSKYRALCATLGTTPRMGNASIPTAPTALVAPANEATAGIQLTYEEEEVHPEFRSNSKPVNSIWRVDRRTPDQDF